MLLHISRKYGIDAKDRYSLYLGLKMKGFTPEIRTKMFPSLRLTEHKLVPIFVANLTARYFHFVNMSMKNVKLEFWNFV